MLRDVINTIEYLSTNIAAASNIMVFLGGAYIALHSRVMPKWAVTCLWYLGLASLLNFITFIVEWTVGQTHPFSHFQLGVVTETLIHFVLASTVGLLFFHTVWKDYLGSRGRNQVKSVPTRGRAAVKKITNTVISKKPIKKVPNKKIPVKRNFTGDLLKEERISL